MILIFIGPQGSGKGTQAEIISKKLSIPHISTGSLLRSAEGDLKKKIEKKTDKGELIGNRLMFKILEKRISEEDCKHGFILDGYPRNLKQAKTLDKRIEFDNIIEIHVSDKTAIKRLTGRRECPKCGRGYNLNVKSLKPKKDEKCDKCKVKLTKRRDDNEKAIKERLKIYHKKTAPILKKYKKRLIRINGEQSIKKVASEIMKKLDKNN